MKVIQETHQVRYLCWFSLFTGTAVATGKVLIFMDSHCEVTEGWLEPLLYEIFKNR